MSYFHYDRLTALDAGMLRLEDANNHMHVGAVALFEAGPLSTPEGELRIHLIRSAMESAIQHTPRFRQKLAYIPMLEHPVWLDDARFNLDYHVRHTALPRPGSIRLLKRLTGRLMSQKLDRSKPLWELWVVEGVEEDRFALVVKAHHCMVDGVAGVELLSAILSPDPEARPEPAGRWMPRPAPSGPRLLADELRHRASLPLSLVGAGWRAMAEPRESLDALRHGVSALRESLTAGRGEVSPTPLDDENGPYRRVDWLRLDIAPALAYPPVSNLNGWTSQSVADARNFLAYATPSSRHPSGVIMTFCDGHTQFIADTLDYGVYQGIMTPYGRRYGLGVLDASALGSQ